MSNNLKITAPNSKGDTKIWNEEDLEENHIANFPPACERSFVRRYNMRFKTSSAYLDICIKHHTNGLFLIYLAKGHSLIIEQKTIEALDFQVGKVNRLNNHFSGKYKSGAQYLNEFDILCKIITTDKQVYPVTAGVAGYLIEINAAVLGDPNIIKNDIDGKGFIAILSPKHPNPKKLDLPLKVPHLLSQAEYEEELSKRNTPVSI